MTGLEKIIKHIEDEADISVKAILSKAENEALKMTTTAKAEGEKKSSEILQQSIQNTQAVLSRAESAALLQEKRLILDTKQQMIGDIIEKAKDTLIQSPNADYCNVILRMITKYALNQKGNILFSQADLKRFPKEFEATINQTLSIREDASLVISEETRNIDGGFVLIYGDVEENCSFDALFFAARESLQDKVSNLLFN